MLKYVRRDPQEIEGISDTCGTVWPMFTESDTSVAEFFIVKSHDAIPHYHTKITEFYHVIDGSGKLILDDEEVKLHKGVTVMINPGTTHRAVGDLSVIVVCVPAGVYQDTHEVSAGVAVSNFPVFTRKKTPGCMPPCLSFRFRPRLAWGGGGVENKERLRTARW